MPRPAYAPRHTLVVVFSLVALLGLARPAAADWAQQQKILSTPRGVGAQFGNAVAISGNTMVIAARHDSTTASQAGAAVVYVRSGTSWTQQVKLLANDGALGDKFGDSVAVSDNTIVIGACNDDGLAGGPVAADRHVEVRHRNEISLRIARESPGVQVLHGNLDRPTLSHSQRVCWRVHRHSPLGRLRTNQCRSDQQGGAEQGIFHGA